MKLLESAKSLIKSRKTEIVVLLALVYELVFPHQFVMAAEPKNSVLIPETTIISQKKAEISQNELVVEELITPVYEVLKTYKISLTGYSSTVDQCDSTPCITANGFNLCEHNQEDVIAANFLPFGTKVRIPQLFGDRIFTVVDRMNARYYYRGDIWFKNRADARKFGIKYATVEVVKEVSLAVK